ncbi:MULTISPECIES: glycosyltransferase family 2 protein [Brenneria]|uniref:Glycosyl transferase n=1 Tax=Brenneria nigrifluens DSM 30175 = ATCC 13028 TaxID=1121120 RepID=A0A2U1UX06_9GAMM|nr:MULTISPECIES: glycosyl transferase [Brenneria]EHD22411.1 glycosyltransferase [Brenneria sp. EniD312]PWC26205.1 glycosyl transferase [Brenneria nigrifluens] [Brenneria nigrifluens DSM 30175 = ATCC 13028]QCR05413.1 glycosyl transferase [Brenneria nigrifluens] [Brenneria nigrifluens DSM 30175 = ATCC 13028]
MWANIILVIMYNKDLQESTTLDTISNYSFNNTKLVIHNNGPREINYEGEFLAKLEHCFDNQVELINCLDNLPLSIIYNEIFSKYNNAEKFIILDDDTEISESFIDAIKISCVDLELPKIISTGDKKIYYPVCKSGIITTDTDLDPESALSIGSGLIINRTLVEKFKKHNLKPFDENYALYGVDFSLFRRIYKIVSKGENVKVRSSSFLMHSLSRLEQSENKNDFRTRERALDIAISARRYPTLHLYYKFFSGVFSEFIKMNWGNMFSMLKAYFLGVHPKCSKN